jgi:hypothetical protein
VTAEGYDPSEENQTIHKGKVSSSSLRRRMVLAGAFGTPKFMSQIQGGAKI